MYENFPYYGYPQYQQQVPPQVPQQIPQQVPQQMPQPQYPQTRIKLDLVQNKTSADVYRVDPGQRVILFDVDNASVYVRERALDGKVTSEDYDLFLHKDEPVKEEPKIDLTKYVKKDDISRIVSDEVEKRMSQITLKPAKKQKGEDE